MAITQVLASNKISSTVKAKALTPIDDLNSVKMESKFPVPLSVQTILVYNSKPSLADTSGPVNTTYWITG